MNRHRRLLLSSSLRLLAALGLAAQGLLPAGAAFASPAAPPAGDAPEAGPAVTLYRTTVRWAGYDRLQRLQGLGVQVLQWRGRGEEGGERKAEGGRLGAEGGGVLLPAGGTEPAAALGRSEDDGVAIEPGTPGVDGTRPPAATGQTHWSAPTGVFKPWRVRSGPEPRLPSGNRVGTFRRG